MPGGRQLRLMFSSYENILASEPPFRPNIKLAKYVEVMVMLGFYLGLIQRILKIAF